ncbi:MAG: M81 family metallopeptidase [Pseudomonadota bacterium]
MKRVFSAVLATETNTFSPIHVDRRAFEASLYALPGEHPESPTLCSAVIPVGRERAAQWQWEFVEGTAAWADPAGPVNRLAYEGLRDEILAQLRESLPLDAVILGLHGAMVADGYDDPEGDLLARVRAIVGDDVLVCATLDPHSHLTRKRREAADYLVAFKEFPHTDFVDCAVNAMSIAQAALQGSVKPVMSTFDCRMIDIYPTTQEPMRSFVDRLKALEQADPEILSISVIHGFLAGDVPEMGTQIIVVTDDNPQKGDALARELGMDLFALRGTCIMPLADVDEAVARAMSAKEGPVVVADVWDNPGGGTPGDATVLLAAFLKAGATNIAFGTIWDPVAVSLCFAAGEGAEIALRFGGKSVAGGGQPIDRVVTVQKLIPDAQQEFGDSLVPVGDTAVIKFDGVEVILNSTRAQAFDTSLFETAGIPPQRRKILVVKSTNHFYASFSKIASEIIYCSAGDMYPNDAKKTLYRKARSDIWPRNDNPHG